MNKMILGLAVVVLMFAGTNAWADLVYGDYTYTVTDGEVTITDYYASYSTCRPHLDIPSTIDGYPVVSIGNYAISPPLWPEPTSSLNDCGYLTSVTIPDSVTSIGAMAFSSNFWLEEITIPASVTSIDEYAFFECNYLSIAYFLGNAPSMGSHVFESNTPICYPDGATGFSTPTWEGYPAAPCCTNDTDCLAGSTCVDGVCVEPECVNDSDCDDGLFCDGAEVCNAGVCESGAAPCSVELCDEASDTCAECLVDDDCDDGLFCDGAEVCNTGVCESGAAPCSVELCDETGDTCAECLVDDDCDDGLFCNGAEVCNAGMCGSGAAPCSVELCDEAGDSCAECLADGDCGDFHSCEANMCAPYPGESSVTEVSLKSPGTIDVIYEPNAVDIARIIVTGATGDSTLTIKSSLKNTTVQLGQLSVDGSLKGLRGKGLELTGPLTVTGGIAKLQLAGTEAGSSIEASWIGKLQVAGDFAGDMALSGAGSPPKDLVLGKATIKGTLADAQLLINGNAGSFKAGTWGAGSTLAVGVAAGDDGLFFTDDDESTGGQLGKIKYKYYDTGNGGEAFGIIAAEFLKMKMELPFVEGDFNIREQ